MEADKSPETVRDVVKLLGGHQAVSKMFDVTIPAVSNWIAADRFPDRLHLRVLRECTAKGIVFDPAKDVRAASA